jgi:hypothetical protein
VLGLELAQVQTGKKVNAKFSCTPEVTLWKFISIVQEKIYVSTIS